MKRSSAGGLIVVVLAVTALGLAGGLVPLRKCPSCDGQRLNVEWAGTPPAKFRILGCPDCADRGQLSLFKSWRRPIVSETVAGVVQALSGEERVALLILKHLITQDGKDPNDFLHISSGSTFSFSDAKFVEAEKKRYLILLTDTSSGTVPGNSAIGVVLLSPEGRALDHVEITCATPNVELTGEILETMSQDGTWITIQSVESRRSFQVIQWQRSLREGVAKGPCRVGIRGDGLELLTPEMK